MTAWMDTAMKRRVSSATLVQINDEITRQEKLKYEGKFEKTCADMGDADSLAVVLEELGEVAEDILAGKTPTKELVETIACMVQWKQTTNLIRDSIEIDGAETLLHAVVALGVAARHFLEMHEERVKRIATGATEYDRH